MKSKKFLIAELKRVFKKELKITVNESSQIYSTNKWDSIANFNLLLSIEKKFKIKFNTEEFNTLNSFKEILKVVSKKFK